MYLKKQQIALTVKNEVMVNGPKTHTVNNENIITMNNVDIGLSKTQIIKKFVKKGLKINLLKFE